MHLWIYEWVITHLCDCRCRFNLNIPGWLLLLLIFLNKCHIVFIRIFLWGQWDSLRLTYVRCLVEVLWILVEVFEMIVLHMNLLRLFEFLMNVWIVCVRGLLVKEWVLLENLRVFKVWVYLNGLLYLVVIWDILVSLKRWCLHVIIIIYFLWGK